MSQAVNNFTLTGNIAQKPEIRTTGNGKKYSFITIAVNGLNRDKAEFISFIVWEKTAENIVKYCDKGDCVSVLGSISSIQKDGKTTLQLNGEAVTFLHKANKKTAPEPKPEEPPFNDQFTPAKSGSDDIFAPF